MNRVENILVVDDNHESLSFLCKLLREEGYKTFPADSGELALASLESNIPDLILLDIRMPGLSGFEVCKTIKQQKDLTEIPIVFLTAATEINEKLEGFRLGAVDYVTKPFHKEELMARIKTHLELYRYNQLFKEQTAEKTIKSEIELNEKNKELLAYNEELIATTEALKETENQLRNKNSELEKSKKIIQEKSQRYKQLFHSCPISLWKEDFCEVLKLLNQKKREEPDFFAYLNNNPDFVAKCASALKVTDINKATLTMFGCENKAQLIAELSKTFNQRSFATFINVLYAIATNKHEFSEETEFVRTDGKIISAIIQIVVMSSNGKAIVAITDITNRKTVELELINQNHEYASLNEEYKIVNEELLAAKNKAEENEQLLTKMAENFPNSFISIIEKDLTVGYSAGQEFTRLNINPNDYVGMSLMQVFGEYEPVIKKHYIETFRGAEKTFELFIYGQHQLYRTVPLFNESNQVSKILVVVENITKRKQAEEKIKKQADFLEVLFEHSLDCIAILDKDYNFVRVSSAYAKSAQRKISDFGGGNYFEMYPSDFKEEADVVKKNKTIYYKQARPFVYPDHPEWGTTYWNVGFVPILNKDDEIDLFILSLQNVTEQTTAKQELIKAKEKTEESEKRFRFLFDNTVQGFVYENSKGEIIYANPAAEKILGISVGQMKGLSSIDPRWKAIHEDGSPYPGETHPIMITLKTGKPVNNAIQGVFNPSTNDYTWINVNSIPIFKDNEPLPHQAIATFEDITELKNMTIELKKAKEKAEESDRLKTEFLNNMSHEIRTPMNGIMGFARFLSNQGLTEEKRNLYVKIIQNSGEQLLRIIDDILEISKLETKQVNAIEEKVCLNDLCLELFSIFEMKAKENKTPLYFNKGLSEEDSTIITDKTKLNKVLSNLLENAFKFTNEGYIEFGYKRKNSKLEIYVKDTGIGIAPEKQTAIFERFSQEEKEMSRSMGGLGLGLSIAKENAELLGGKIDLQSEKGKGSVFSVIIPYKPALSKREEGYINNCDEETDEGQKKYTILIAEDEEVNFLYLEALLDEEINLDCEVIHAKNGQEAVRLCKDNFNVNIVLMDLKMPIMNGYEAIKQIKEFRPDLPIIAQTAYVRKEDMKKAYAAGCDDYISKPIDEEILCKILRKYIDS